MNNFSNVPNDNDTKTIEELDITIKGIPVLYQKWIFDGITANTLIFHSKDVEQFTDDKLLEFIKEHSDIKVSGSVTFHNSNDYRFVNYNFETS